MQEKNIKISGSQLILGFVSALETSKGIRKIMNDRGEMVIPEDRFGDFCHDIAIMLGRVIEHVAESE